METSTPVTTALPRWLPALLAGVLVLLPLAFFGGWYFARSGNTPTPTPTEQVPVEGELPDGKSEGPEPADGEETLLEIEWVPAAYQQEVESTASFWQAVRTGEIFPSDGLRFSGYQGYRLGTVSSGQYRGYTLVEHILERGELGISRFHIYTLERWFRESREGDLSIEKPHTIILSLYPFTEYSLTSFVERNDDEGIMGVVNLQPEVRHMLGELALGDQAQAQIRADLRVSALEFPQETAATDNGTLQFLGIGNRLDYPDRLWTGEYPVVLQGVNGASYAVFHADTAQDSFYGVEEAFFTVRADGHVLWYVSPIPFFSDSAQEAIAIPDVLLNNQQVTARYAVGQLGGCGLSSVRHVVEESKLPVLVQTGHARIDASIQIFEPRDYNEASLDGDFTSWRFQNPEGTREQFAALHPLLFWRDEFGRWIQFTHVDVLPAAECGKPVIYLYPERTTAMRVEVAPKGGFTFTEPAYNDGWNVVAHPDGRIVNTADGKTYPYLFWEGRGNLYRAPERYWVVTRAEVPAFLERTLARFAFNTQEIADFKEFWVPRMQDAPYYKIGFHGNQMMELLAPLHLSQTPQTLVRILMDFEALSAPIPSNPPQLPPTPARRGFTVMEWGGVLR